MPLIEYSPLDYHAAQTVKGLCRVFCFMTEYLKILDDESTDNELVIEGYIALYGGVDLTGEYFTPNTDFESNYTRTNSVVIDWEHGQEPDKVASQPGRDDILGKIEWATTRSDDIGLLARHVLDRRERYVSQFVEPLARAGLIGSSSEATPKTVTKTKSGEITRWPIKRQSLTVTPAEPRLLTTNQLQVIKSLANEYPQLKALLIGDQEIAGGDAADIINPNNGEYNMPTAEEIKALINDAIQAALANQSQPDLEALTAKAGKAAADEVKAYLDSKPAPKKGGVVVTEDEADRALEGNPFKSAEEFYVNVRNAATGMSVDQRLLPLKHTMADEGAVYTVPTAVKSYMKAPQGLGELIPSDGGFLVGTDRINDVTVRDYRVGQVWNRAMPLQIGEGSNGATINVLKETSRVAGSRWGGVVGYWLAEADSITASKPTFDQLEPKLKKVGALVYATEEMLQDATLLTSVINNTVPQELMFQKDGAAISGSGVGRPLGILNSAATVSVAKESGQPAATIEAVNIIKMRARRWGGGRYVWFINQDVEPQLHQLNLPVGTGGALVYMPPGGLSGLPYGTLYGDPVIPIEHCATLGTVGDIILADMSQYLTIQKGGTMTASSIHVRFVNDESVYRFIERVDGMPVWKSALTPVNGTNTQSPFVTLATRS